LSCLKFSEASTSPVIPEIFYRESKFLLSLVLNTVDPGSKVAGVTDLRKRKRVEGEGKAQERVRSLLLFRPLVEPFRNEGLGDDRTIQG